ncbi:sensor histidine kinase [Robertkochia solimangrovi]|uniref:sensor histidine kinase n=1 Tax=Robertkochia solimangrovi TaxID=2213046 RepID=UPI00117BED11|nr:HAMP domain-containing sensor histidine kinase [Robertkochia solimangrovi]TRZ45704.1 hypothetical protein DMZ48_00020 [Robertkochia solimangrovi]
MNKKVRFLLVLSVVTIISVLVLQFLWVGKYYRNVRYNYERDINLAFEDALRKDFQLRCDTIEKLLIREFLNPEEYSIASAFDQKLDKWKYSIINRHDSLDKITFTPAEGEFKELTPERVAAIYAQEVREDDLEHHFVYYRTQNLGKYLSEKIVEFQFDTLSFRPIFDAYLQRRAIHSQYQLQYQQQSNLYYDHQTDREVIDTRTLPTHKWYTPEEGYVHASFTDLHFDIFSKISREILSSLLLIMVTAICIVLLFKALLNEKKMAKIKDDFISNISHELKTPVAVIAASLETVTDKQITLEPEKKARFLEHARSEVQHLNSLVEELLQLSLYENKTLPVNPENFDYSFEIEKIISAFQTTQAENFKTSITHTSADPFLYTDLKHFRIIVGNVLENAIKYRKQTAHIHIISKKSPDELQIEILDDGAGITKDDLPRVLDRFYRAPGKAHQVKGQGLGLYIVKNLIELNKGSIQIESKRNEFTKVILAWKL